MIFLRIFPLVLCVSLSACATTTYPPAPSRLTADQATYTLNTGDSIKVTVFDEENLSGTYAVDRQGMIAMPLIGKTSVSGQTEPQAARTITQALKAGNFLKQPNVSVETSSMRPFYVLGEVEKGGKYPYHSGLTVYQAVAIASGYTYRADRDDITIRRQSNKFTANESTPILPGDVIEIGERYF